MIALGLRQSDFAIAQDERSSNAGISEFDEPRLQVISSINAKQRSTYENPPNVEMMAGISHGWPDVLANFKSLLETGDVLPQGTTGDV